MARTEKVIMTNMCMVFSENRVLVQDKTGDDYSGITFPGGHVERGESFTDAVIREVWEETGLKISEPKLCGIKDWMKDEETRYIVLLYKTDKFEGIVTSSEEGDVFWLTLDEMKQRKLVYGMDKMLEVFLNANISEYFFFEENGKDGKDLFDKSFKPRTGEYQMYHHGDMNAFHISYFRRKQESKRSKEFILK